MTPILLPKSGTYVNKVSIKITSATDHAILYYTLNGYNPDPNILNTDNDRNNMVKVENGGLIDLDTPGKFVLKVLCQVSGMENSLISEGIYTIFGKVETPSFEEVVHDGDVLPAPAVLHLKCSTEKSRIYYTTDGSFPTASSELYRHNEGIIFEDAGLYTIKAIALHDELAQSDVASVKFHVKSRANAPSPSPPPGHFVGNVDVTVNCNGSFYYTMDGTIPISPNENNASESLPCGSSLSIDGEGRDSNVMLRVIVQGNADTAPSVPAHYLYSITRRAQEVWPIMSKGTDNVSPDVKVYVVEKVSSIVELEADWSFYLTPINTLLFFLQLRVCCGFIFTFH